MWTEQAIRKALDWMVEQNGGKPIRAVGIKEHSGGKEGGWEDRRNRGHLLSAAHALAHFRSNT